jgi:hypothetical protein
VKRILILFTFWRALLWVPLLLGSILITERGGYEYTLFTDYLQKDGIHTVGFSNVFFPYANFDGINYITIAYQGYNLNAGFFPLFPVTIGMLGRALNVIVPLELPTLIFYSGLLLSSLFLLAGLYFFYKLLKLDYKESVRSQAIMFLLCFPASFYFAAVYSESLFFLLLILMFYFARKRQWVIVAILGVLLTATRPIGVAVIPAMIYEFLSQQKITPKELLLQPLHRAAVWLSALLLSITPLLGIGIYSVFNNARWNDYLYFIHAQGEFENNRSVSSIVFFPQTVFRYIKILFTVSSAQFEWWIAFLELAVFFFVCFLLFIARKKKVRRSYLIFAVVSFLIPISTGTFSGLPRYALILFPLFVALALVKSNAVKAAYVVVGSILLVLLFMYFSRGYYIA